MRSIHRQVLLSTAVVIGAGWAPLLCAQEMAPGTGDPRQAEPTAGDEQAAPGDIIVTAQRRSQSIQNIPLAIQAVEGDTLISAGVLQVSQLSTVSPSFVYSASGGEPTIGLRGIGGELSQIAAEPSVSLSLDGVPLLRQQYFLGSFFDVERVEVLRGPQGTIAGRNATGGAVNIITRKPTERLEGGLDATYGNFGTFNIGMWASGPVVADTLAAHFAIERRKSDGYVTSSITGERLGGHDDILARVALLAKPAEGIELLLSGDYFNSQDNSPAYVGLGLYDPENVAAVIDPPGFGSAPAYDRDTRRAEIAGLPGERELFTQRSQGVNLQGSFELGAGTMLKTITGYRELKGDQRYESVRGPVPINPIYTPYAQHQFSQEATLTSSFGDAVDILIGGQYLDETARQQTSVIYLRGLASPDFAGAAAVDLTAHDQIKLRSIAAFGQMEWRLAPTLQLTVGGRYTSDRKTYRGQLSIPAQTPPLPPPFGPDIRQRATFNKFTPRIALDWKPSDRVTAYASWSQGFKAGGFGTAGALTPGFGPFEPETVNNYELGLKTNSFDRRLTANLTGFWADYKNLQYPFYVAPATIITNAGKARVRGVELELGYHPSR
ncbi:MAG: TonB-dependent receptor, partial [Beijerinckiaceae bacterium]|nr:TonB-dependent receptor [Beijerinckiaceae bacterium]